MESSILILTAFLVPLLALVVARGRPKVLEAGREAFKQLKMVIFTIPLGLLTAAIAAKMISATFIATYLGYDTGMAGVMIAMLAGSMIPAGPAVSFPLALLIWDAGAGVPQLITFLTAWSVFAFHRVLTYELPMMGSHFVVIRLASCWMLPPLVGWAALLIA